MYSAAPKIAGYHGTYPRNVDGIVQNNFFESKNHEIWLGDGVYFFVEGIGIFPPMVYAKQFAKDQCWDKDEKKYKETEIVVLEAVIRINNDKFLDLTDFRATQLFNQFRQDIIEKIEKSGKFLMGKYKDADVFKLMREKLGIEFVKANVYIKFAAQRIGQFDSIIPNVTILAVNNPTQNIQKRSIRQMVREAIRHEL